jgi:hypothetical protein
MMGRKSYTEVTSPKSRMSTNSIMPANMSAIIARFLRRRKGCLPALVDLPSTAEGKLYKLPKKPVRTGNFPTNPQNNGCQVLQYKL